MFLDLDGLAKNIFVILDAIFNGPLASVAYIFLFVAAIVLVLSTVVHGRGEN